MSSQGRTDSAGIWGQWIAMAAAVILTAKGEYDLAVYAHFAPWIAWMYPVMLDVYVVTAFHRRRAADMVVGMLLMLFSQIAVHLLPVWIDTEGKTGPEESVPWGLVVAVACVAPIVVVRVKMLAGKTGAELSAAEDAERKAEELRNARTELDEANRKKAEAERAVRAEQAKRKSAEERVEAEEQKRKNAEEQAAQEAADRAEEVRELQAQIARLTAAATEARSAATAAQAEAAQHLREAGVAAGQLAEARELAERALVERDAARRSVEGLTEARQAVADELERVRQSYNRLSRRAEEVTVRAEGTRKAERNTGRKKLAAVPAELAEGVPHVEGVKPELVAAVLAARAEEPDAKQGRLAELAGTSDRTVRKVLNALPVPVRPEETIDDRAAV